MSRFTSALRSLVLVGLSAITFTASATNYTLWVNGRNNPNYVNKTTQNYNDFASYWGPSSTAAGVNKKAVNWDGHSTIANQSFRLKNALDCFCTGTNWCYIATHSAGNLMTGYTLARDGATARPKITTPTPSANGVCTAASGAGTQTGWNIKWVRNASGAAGGSELSDIGGFITGVPLDANLKTSTARALYDHNVTANVNFFMYAGASGTFYAAALPGQDDEAVSYHSTGGTAGTSGISLNNPADFFANDLTLGTAANEGGSVKWRLHSVVFRDDKEAFNHYTSANNVTNWLGIVSVVRAAVVSTAQ